MDSFRMLVNYFDGNMEKAMEWCLTPNPILGDLRPHDLLRLGRIKQLNEFIKNQIEGDTP